MKYRRELCSAVLLSLVFLGSLPDARADEGLGLGVKAGTLGAGIELSASLINNTRLRGGFNYLTYSFDSTISDIDYDFESEFNSFSVMLDWHPFGNSFFLSGGAYFNNNSISVSGTASDDSIGSLSPQLGALTDLVSISGDVEFAPVAPYAGLGWRSNNSDSGWGISLDLGVLFQGTPDVTNLRLNAPVDVNQFAEVQDFLAEQEKEIKDDLDIFQFYPVATLMLIYHF